jgi:hypothetical protein
VRLTIVESNLGLLDESSALESIVEDFKLLNGQVSIHFDYYLLDPYASGRKAGHLGSVLSEGILVEKERYGLIVTGSAIPRFDLIPRDSQTRDR